MSKREGDDICGSARRPTVVNREHGAGNVATFRAAQEHHQRCHVLGRDEPAGGCFPMKKRRSASTRVTPSAAIIRRFSASWIGVVSYPDREHCR